VCSSGLYGDGVDDGDGDGVAGDDDEDVPGDLHHISLSSPPHPG